MSMEPEVPHIEVDDETKDVIREMLSQMESPVTIRLFTSQRCGDRDTNWCVPTEELIDLISGLAPQGKVHVEKYKWEVEPDAFNKFGVDVSRVPVLMIQSDYITYYGSPLGEEVRALIETVVRVSNGRTGLRAKTRDMLRQLSADDNAERVTIMTMVTPSCPYCPYAVLMANMFAYESQGKVRSLVVEAMENPDIADMYGVTGVPTIVLKTDRDMGNVEFIGVPPEADLLNRVLEYSSANR